MHCTYIWVRIIELQSCISRQFKNSATKGLRYTCNLLQSEGVAEVLLHRSVGSNSNRKIEIAVAAQKVALK